MSWDIQVCEPKCDHCNRDFESVFDANITWNLMPMFYDAFDLPGEMNFRKYFDEKLAKEVVDMLKSGVEVLEKYPEKYQAMNPDNGWGSYAGLCRVLQEWIKICEEYPEGVISIWWCKKKIKRV